MPLSQNVRLRFACFSSPGGELWPVDQGVSISQNEGLIGPEQLTSNRDSLSANGNYTRPLLCSYTDSVQVCVLKTFWEGVIICTSNVYQFCDKSTAYTIYEVHMVQRPQWMPMCQYLFIPIYRTLRGNFIHSLKWAFPEFSRIQPILTFTVYCLYLVCCI